MDDGMTRSIGPDADTDDWIRRLNMIERVKRNLILVRESAYGRCNDVVARDEDWELLMAIGGAAEEAIDAIKADAAAQLESERALPLEKRTASSSAIA